jgi:hypothetical protein
MTGEAGSATALRAGRRAERRREFEALVLEVIGGLVRGPLTEHRLDDAAEVIAMAALEFSSSQVRELRERLGRRRRARAP